MKEDSCAVLLIEDNNAQSHSVKHVLSRCHCRFEVDWVCCLSDAKASLALRRFDVLLCDLALPDSAGIDTVTAIRKLQPYTPLIVLTSLPSDHTALEALEQGAQDFLAKDSLVADSAGPEVLERAIRHAIRRQVASHKLLTSYRQARRSQRLLKKRNQRREQLYMVAQNVVENVSHEFRTPLSVIKEYVSLIRDGLVGEITDEQGHFLDVIGDRSEDLNRMVDDMLDVSQLDSKHLSVRRTECDVAEIVRHVVLNLRKKAALKKVTLTIDIEGHLPKVYCDADRAGRTMINLVVAAIKFCGNPGLVKIAVRLNAPAREVVITVTDNGPGVHEKELQKIFTRFTQVDVEFRDGAKGFGLGLSIAKEMVGLNLGQITATSVLGTGSCFAFTLPVMDPVDIARRFLTRLDNLGPGDSATVSLGIVWAEEEDADPEARESIEPLLYDVLRENGLVVRVRPLVWAVLLAVSADRFEAFRHRLAKGRRKKNRKQLRHPLPPLGSAQVGAWMIHQHLETVLAKVDEIAHQYVGTLV